MNRLRFLAAQQRKAPPRLHPQRAEGQEASEAPTCRICFGGSESGRPSVEWMGRGIEVNPVKGYTRCRSSSQEPHGFPQCAQCGRMIRNPANPSNDR